MAFFLPDWRILLAILIAIIVFAVTYHYTVNVPAKKREDKNIEEKSIEQQPSSILKSSS